MHTITHHPFKRLLIFLFAVLLFESAGAQSIFMKLYQPIRGSSFSLQIHSIIPLAGKKMLYVCNSNQLGNSKMMVVTTDESGTRQSGFHHGVENGELVTYKSVMGADSSIYTTGYFKHNAVAPSEYYLYLNKMRPGGTILWEKYISVPGATTTVTSGYDLCMMPDSSVVVAGVTGSPKKGVIIRFSPSGTVVWEKQYFGLLNTWFNGVALSPAGDLLLSGIDSLGAANTQKMMTARVSSVDGTPVWMRRLNYIPFYMDGDVISLADGNVASCTGELGKSTVLAKYDYATGAPSWVIKYGPGDTLMCSAMVQAPNGDILMGGKAGPGLRPGLLRVNSSGTHITNKVYTTAILSLGSGIRSIILHPDGSLLANSENYVIKARVNLTTCTGSSVTCLSPTTTAGNISGTLITSNGLNPPATFTTYRFGAATWTVGSYCGGKCNVVDNLAAGLYLSDDEYCQGKDIQFYAADVNITSREWYLDGTLINNTNNFFTRQMNVVGNHEVKLIATDSWGCKDTATSYINITNCGGIQQPPATVRANLFVSSGTNQYTRLALAPNNGIVYLSNSNTNNGMDVRRIDDLGNLVWGKKFYGTNSNLPRGLFRAANGDYVAMGVYNNTHALLVRLDANGNYLWHNHYRVMTTSAGNVTAYDCTELPDGSIIMVGGTQYGPIGSGNGYGYIIKTDANGTLQWEKNYQFGSSQTYFSATGYVNNKLFVGGYAYVNTTWCSPIMIVDPANGNLTSSWRIPVLGEPTDFTSTPDGKMMISLYGGGTGNSAMVKVDGDNKIMWDAAIAWGTGGQPIFTADSGMVMPACSTSGVTTTYITKVDKYGWARAAFRPDEAKNTNVVRDANGTFWTVTGGYTMVMDKFHAEIDMVNCSTIFSPGNTPRNGTGFVTTLPTATDNNGFEDLQPLNVQNLTGAYNQLCSSAGCLTNAQFRGPIIACPNIPITYYNEGFMGASYEWKIDGAVVSTNQDLLWTFTNGGTYSLRLIATGLNGCKDSVTQTITVPNVGAVHAASNSPVPSLGNINLTVDTVVGATYQWTGPNGYSTPVQNPVIVSASPIHSGTYYVTVTAGQCAAFDSVVVLVTSGLYVSGSCYTENGDSIQAVKVNLSGSLAMNQTTPFNGSYTFNNLVVGGNYTLRPSKNNDVDKDNGVTTLDLVLIRRHILGVDTLDSPYKILAADANNSNNVTALDMTFIRNLILGNDTTFPGNRLWDFVPASTVFTDTLNPWSPASPPDSIYLSFYSAPLTGRNFIGMKLGDVNHTWNPLIAKTQYSGEVALRMDDVSGVKGSRVSVPVRMAENRSLAGMQGTLNWMPGVMEMEAITGGIPGFHFGKSKSAEGMLSFSWDEENGALSSLGAGSTLFTLHFILKGDAGNQTEIRLGDALADAQAYNESLDILRLVAAPGKAGILNEEELPAERMAVSPNPGTGRFSLELYQDLRQAWDLKVLNSLGQVIHEARIDAFEGEYIRTVDLSGASAGIYTFMLSNGTKAKSMKVVME